MIAGTSGVEGVQYRIPIPEVNDPNVWNALQSQAFSRMLEVKGLDHSLEEFFVRNTLLMFVRSWLSAEKLSELLVKVDQFLGVFPTFKLVLK